VLVALLRVQNDELAYKLEQRKTWFMFTKRPLMIACIYFFGQVRVPPVTDAISCTCQAMWHNHVARGSNTCSHSHIAAQYTRSCHHR